MNPEITALLTSLKSSISGLNAQNLDLQQQIASLNANNQLLKNQLAQQKNTIETLQTQNKITKLAEILPQDENERRELKQQLQAYINHIDECIRLLSEN